MTIAIRKVPRFGTLNNTASSGITVAAGGKFEVEERVDEAGVLHTTKITMPRWDWTTTAADKAVGQLLYTFPEGVIKVLGSRVSVSLVPGNNFTAAADDGEIALGNTIGSGAVDEFSAGMEDLVSAHGNLTSGTAATAGAERHLFDEAAILDGATTAKKVHLNIAASWGGTGGAYLAAGGTVTIAWIDLQDL